MGKRTNSLAKPEPPEAPVSCHSSGTIVSTADIRTFLEQSLYESIREIGCLDPSLPAIVGGALVG